MYPLDKVRQFSAWSDFTDPRVLSAINLFCQLAIRHVISATKTTPFS